MRGEQVGEQARFVVRAHVGAGPWRWEVRDTHMLEAVAFHVEKQDADNSAASLNEKGYVDVS